MIKLHLKLLFWQHAISDKEQSGKRTLCFFHQIISGKIDKFPFPTQPAWMHLRCISETSHAASQRHLKEGWFANLGDASGEMY